MKIGLSLLAAYSLAMWGGIEFFDPYTRDSKFNKCAFDPDNKQVIVNPLFYSGVKTAQVEQTGENRYEGVSEDNVHVVFLTHADPEKQKCYANSNILPEELSIKHSYKIVPLNEVHINSY